jgi:hypothetical protein
MCRLVSFWRYLEQGCCPTILGPLLFPGKLSSAKEGCSGSGGWFYMVKLDQGCTPTWEKLAWLDCWIQRANSATLTVVWVDKIQQKGPSNGVLMVGDSIYLFIFYPDSMFFLILFVNDLSFKYLAFLCIVWLVWTIDSHHLVNKLLQFLLVW